MAVKPKTAATGRSGNATGAEVVADFTSDGFDPNGSQSEVKVSAAKTGSLGSAIHAALCAARDGLIAAGQTPPAGLTLRAKRIGDVQGDGPYTVDVAFYYGDPTDNTEAQYIGATPSVADGTPVEDGEA